MKKNYATLLALFISYITMHSIAQTPIVNVSKSYVSSTSSLNYRVSGAPGSSFSDSKFDYSFGKGTQSSKNTQKLIDFTIGTDVYSYSQNASSTVKIRRVDNANVKGSRTLLWVEQLSNAKSSQVAVINPYNDNMELAFSNNALNQGTDNLFANQGDGNGNNNNIERLDVVFQGGLISSINTKVGFALFERGSDNTHDAFVIAAITGIDINGNPTGYANPVRVSGAKYGNLPSSEINYYVVRRDLATESTLKMSTSGKQDIGGVFLSLSDLGIAKDVKIYGYSIFAADLPANAKGADLVNYKNTNFFPTNTNSSNEGGIDLIALTGVLSIQNTLTLPPTAENIIGEEILNTSEPKTIVPFNAKAASGSIAAYTIQTIPSPEQGVLTLCKNNNCIPVTAGQALTPAEISQLSFKPNNTFIGSAIFYYNAKDTYTQVSNTASYTIPVVTLNILPVKLTRFNGSINGKSTQLNWQTVQEINSSIFEVQRSTDGINFEPIETVTAKGFSNGSSLYETKDDISFLKGAVIYYRLKMVDINGKFTYSGIVMLKTTTSSVVNKLTAWPNPFSNQLNADFASEKDGIAQLKISGTDGKTILQYNISVKKGQNILTINQAQKMPKGTYILTIFSDNKMDNIKIIKQ